MDEQTWKLNTCSLCKYVKVNAVVNIQYTGLTCIHSTTQHMLPCGCYNCYNWKQKTKKTRMKHLSINKMLVGGITFT